ENLEEGLDWRPDFAVIASPTDLHAMQALQAARSGCHLFIEKPLSHTEAGLKELQEEISGRNLITLVGCNMRFHPGPAKVKELLEHNAIGKILFARVHTGSYLPQWRPGQDYLKSYSANASMGGGCILDCIHEIDLARWYLGEMEDVFCRAEHLSSMKMDVEDTAILVCKHFSGALSEVHLDYVQRTYERGCQIAGEDGSIFWDYRQGQVRWFDASSDQWKTYSQAGGWTVNQMYIDEMRHFLRCLEEGAPTMLPVDDAARLMNVVFAAKRSAATGRTVRTGIDA
ncbi:MAG: gfo/Idh/MocA family oxidoreductase, partial [Methanothrix sp.]